MRNSLLKKIMISLTPRERYLSTRLENGAIVLGKNKPGYGGRGVYLSGDDIEPEFKHLTKFLTPDSVFIDIGANTGVYSLKAAKHLSGSGEVISLEPNLDMLEALSASVKINRFRNVRLRNLCASNLIGHADFWCNSGKPNSFSLVRHDNNADRMSVVTVPLDSLVEWESLERIDYIKIDVEGSEDIVLEGAKKSITRFRPIVQYEVSIREVIFNFPNYVGFHPDSSSNYIYFPSESQYVHVADQLGWKRL
jgi:FkbM family methyltransferase